MSRLVYEAYAPTTLLSAIETQLNVCLAQSTRIATLCN